MIELHEFIVAGIVLVPTALLILTLTFPTWMDRETPRTPGQ